MSFDRVLPDANGATTLPPGRYFIDNNEGPILQALPELADFIPDDSILETNDSGGRGFMMVSFRFPNPVTIPRSVLLKTGFFYVMPDDMTLNDVSRTLYGDTFTQSVGFWEWLANNHPDVFEAAKATAETIVETSEAVKKEVKGHGKALLYLAAGGLAVYFVAKLARKRDTVLVITDEEGGFYE